MTLKQLIELAESQGWRTRKTKRGHVVFYAPDGSNTVTVGGTPSDHRSRKNSLARLKAAGLEVPRERNR